MHAARLEYHYQKGSYYVLEQPSSSLLFRYKPIKAMSQSFVSAGEALLRRHGARQVHCSLGALGARTLKPVP